MTFITDPNSWVAWVAGFVVLSGIGVSLCALVFLIVVALDNIDQP